MSRNQRRSGNTLLEFTLVGIPLMFAIISIFEMARGMWTYHTLAHAVKEGARFAAVHGSNCAKLPNTCAATVGQIAARVSRHGTGLIPAQVRNFTLESQTRKIVCPQLSDCVGDTTLAAVYWPANAPGAPRDPGGQRGMDVRVSAEYPFQSALAMFWPGAGRTVQFGTYVFPASSKERIQY